MDEIRRLISALDNFDTVVSGTKEGAEKRCEELIQQHMSVSGSMTDAQIQAVIDSEFTDSEAQGCFDTCWEAHLNGVSMK